MMLRVVALLAVLGAARGARPVALEQAGLGLAAAPAPGCEAAAFEKLHEECAERYADLRAELDAGKITQDEYQKESAKAAEECQAAAAALAKKCYGPSDEAVEAAPAAWCKKAAAELQAGCKKAYDALEAALKAGEITKEEFDEKLAVTKKGCEAKAEFLKEHCAAEDLDEAQAPGCEAAAFEKLHEECAERYADLRAELDAGKITQDEYQKESAKAAEECQAAAAALAKKCYGPSVDEE